MQGCINGLTPFLAKYLFLEGWENSEGTCIIMHKHAQSAQYNSLVLSKSRQHIDFLQLHWLETCPLNTFWHDGKDPACQWHTNRNGTCYNNKFLQFKHTHQYVVPSASVKHTLACACIALRAGFYLGFFVWEGEGKLDGVCGWQGGGCGRGHIRLPDGAWRQFIVSTVFPA